MKCPSFVCQAAQAITKQWSHALFAIYSLRMKVLIKQKVVKNSSSGWKIGFYLNPRKLDFVGLDFICLFHYFCPFPAKRALFCVDIYFFHLVLTLNWILAVNFLPTIDFFLKPCHNTRKFNLASLISFYYIIYCRSKIWRESDDHYKKQWTKKKLQPTQNFTG